MATKKYVSLSKLSTFLDKLKTIFAYKTDLDKKANIDHAHNEIYYTKTEIDNMEFVTTDDIDAICNSTV